MMVSGGFRPEAEQNNPFSVSGTGGDGQSGKFVAEKAAKAAQLRPSGFTQGMNTAISQQISEGGNVATTANAANPASKLPSGEGIAQILGAIEPLDSEPQEFRPITDGIDGYSGRGSEVIPKSLNPNNRQIENVDLIKRYLPDLLNAARIPGAPDSYKRMINSLMREIM
jgi:hypothetical protein